MRLKKNIPFNWSVLIVPLGFVLSLWVVFWIEIRFGVRFKHFGILPGKLEGILGIITGPWIHSGLSHLSNNSLPMLFLLAALFYFYKPIAMRVLFIGLVLTGLLTWLIGRPSWHIGASGLIYMLVSFSKQCRSTLCRGAHRCVSLWWVILVFVSLRSKNIMGRP